MNGMSRLNRFDRDASLLLPVQEACAGARVALQAAQVAGRVGQVARVAQVAGVHGSARALTCKGRGESPTAALAFVRK